MNKSKQYTDLMHKFNDLMIQSQKELIGLTSKNETNMQIVKYLTKLEFNIHNKLLKFIGVNMGMCNLSLVNSEINSHMFDKSTDLNFNAISLFAGYDLVSNLRLYQKLKKYDLLNMKSCYGVSFDEDRVSDFIVIGEQEEHDPLQQQKLALKNNRYQKSKLRRATTPISEEIDDNVYEIKNNDSGDSDDDDDDDDDDDEEEENEVDANNFGHSHQRIGSLSQSRNSYRTNNAYASSLSNPNYQTGINNDTMLNKKANLKHNQLNTQQQNSYYHNGILSSKELFILNNQLYRICNKNTDDLNDDFDIHHHQQHQYENDDSDEECLEDDIDGKMKNSILKTLELFSKINSDEQKKQLLTSYSFKIFKGTPLHDYVINHSKVCENGYNRDQLVNDVIVFPYNKMEEIMEEIVEEKNKLKTFNSIDLHMYGSEGTEFSSLYNYSDHFTREDWNKIVSSNYKYKVEIVLSITGYVVF
jgi:hypothetical protein